LYSVDTGWSTCSYVRASCAAAWAANLSFARVWCAQNGIDRLLIFSDPHARGFYEHLGAAYMGEAASSIPGRTVPLMELIIQP